MNDLELMETIADVAYLCGCYKFYSGDSRSDISKIISWAEQFEPQHVNTDWDSDDYILSVEEVAMSRILQAGSEQ